MKKHFYKIFAFVLIMFCALTGLAACGNNEFSVSACRQAYVKAGYTVVDMNVAFNQTRQYIEQKKEDKSPELKKYYLVSENKNNLEKLYNDVYKSDGTKQETKDIHIYTNSGFIAYNNSEIIVIVAYKSTPSIDGFKNQIHNNIYSNVSKNSVKNVYSFTEKD